MPASPNQRAAARDKRERARELHLAGASYDTIATAVGYASRGAAYRAVQAALTDARAPVDEDSDLLALARLDALLTGVWPAARRGDVAAVDRVLDLEERRAQVLARLRRTPPPDPHREPPTGLSAFERRLRERGGTTERSGI